MRFFQLAVIAGFNALILFSLVPSSLATETPDSTSAREASFLDEQGTNVRGQSGDFADYLNEAEGSRESGYTELIQLGDDTHIGAGGEEDENPGVGIRLGY